MNNRFTKTAVTLATVTGISLSAGYASADSVQPAPQENAQVQEESKVEKRLDKVEKKADAVQSELESIEGAIEGAPITVEQVQMYTEYLDELESLLNRLDAAENHLDAITKKMEDEEDAIEEAETEINDVRTSILEVQETIHAIFAEQMSSNGVIPDGVEAAEDPTYEVGSEAIIEADHMPGMYGAEATIAGAFDTVAYSVTYYPTTGGEPVENHKWVIHEELEDPGEAPLEPGTEVVLDADHMKGMNGATAVIESAEDTTVYMVDFTTTAGKEVENHKWVTESELSPVE
nr:YdhK family protein [Salinicoccus roseus]